MESLGIKVFGKNKVNFDMRDVFVITFSGTESESVQIECFLVEEISNITNEHVEVVKNNFSHLVSIYFSDGARNEDFLEVDILVVSDFIWEFQRGELIRGGPSEPVAVKITLGWVLSGPLRGSKPSGTDCNINFVPNTMQGKKQLEESLHKLWDLDTLRIREKDDVHTTLLIPSPSQVAVILFLSHGRWGTRIYQVIMMYVMQDCKTFSRN